MAFPKFMRFLHDRLSAFAVKILSKFVSAHRKSYSSNHVFILSNLICIIQKILSIQYENLKYIKKIITHALNFMKYFKGHKVVKITTNTK